MKRVVKIELHDTDKSTVDLLDSFSIWLEYLVETNPNIAADLIGGVTVRVGDWHHTITPVLPEPEPLPKRCFHPVTRYEQIPNMRPGFTQPVCYDCGTPLTRREVEMTYP